MNIRKFSKIWGAPVILAVLGLYGLISALVGNGIYDIIACMMLLIPLVIIIKYSFWTRKNIDPDS